MRWVWIAGFLMASCASEDLPVEGADTSSPPTAPSLADPPTTPPVTTATTEPVVAPDFSTVGGVAFVTQDASIVSGGCTLSYTRFQPDQAVSDVNIVLSHGFMRNRRHVAGWAEHLASWGLMVYTPNLCHTTAFDSDHVQNGIDLVALATSVARGGGTIYIGHSAGGLASLLAASTDPAAVAVLGLDPVDSGGLGVAAAADLAIPARALLAEGSSCNSQNNGYDMTVAASDHQALLIPGADHCSFESPTDAGCTLFCGGQGGLLTEYEIAETVAAMSVAYGMWQSGAQTEAGQWWTPGAIWYDLLLDDGRIVAR